MSAHLTPTGPKGRPAQLFSANTRFVSPKGPWSLSELERIIASSQTLDDAVGDVPSRLWWPAFLLTMLDTAEPPRRLLAAPRTDYDQATGELSIGSRVYELHALAVDAIRLVLPYGAGPELFHWPLDPPQGDRRVFHMLGRRFKEILFRAETSSVTANMFPRLLLTAQQRPNLLAALTLDIHFVPRDGKPRFSRARDRGHTDQSQERSTPARPPADAPDVVILCMEPTQTLLHFLETSYAPLRLADANPDQVEAHRSSLKRYGRFLACEATYQNLNDDQIERFLAWLKQSGMANGTINGYRARLLALWNHAYRKRRVSEPPGYVQKYRIPKRMPEAWSLESMQLILQTAAQVKGRICGIPAGDWWTALILVLYETGLRIGAALAIAVSDLNLETRWMTVWAENQKQDADQIFRLHPETIAAIERTLVAPRLELFPWPYGLDGKNHALNKHYRKILKQAGLAHGPRDLFHKFRRTSATAVARLADEQAAKQHLGHSHLDVTRRYIDQRQLNNRRTIGEQIERPDLGRHQDDESAAAP